MDGDDGFGASLRGAMRLVRAGALREATRAIQAALMRRTGAPAKDDPAPIEARILRDALAPPETAAEPVSAERDAPQARQRAAESDVAPAARAPRTPMGLRAPAAAPAIARRARTSAPLRARLARPPQGEGARPLLVMLHGCKQDPEDFARGTRMDRAAHERGWYVLYPAQSARANGSRCWNWFDPAARTAGAGQDGALLELVDRTIAAHPIDPARVYVAGLSAGAAMAVLLGANHPERFAAVGAHSGLPYGAAANVPDAFAAMRDGGSAPALPGGRYVPLVSIHGDADATVSPRNADQLVAQWLEAGEARAWTRETGVAQHGRARVERWRDAGGRVVLEDWRCVGLGHAWSGGDAAGSYTDASAPDATTILLDFFERHALESSAA